MEHYPRKTRKGANLIRNDLLLCIVEYCRIVKADILALSRERLQSAVDWCRCGNEKPHLPIGSPDDD